jgi:PPOX class probable F420-dependent enzyme
VARALPTSLSEEARAFLDAHRIAHLATVDAHVIAPHVVPLCYARIDDRVYFVVDDKPKQPGRQLKRLRNIAGCPHIALLVDDYDEDWSRLAYLLLQCEATRVTSQREFGAALDVLRQRYPQYLQMSLALATHPMVRMEIRRWHFWRAAERQRERGIKGSRGGC